MNTRILKGRHGWEARSEVQLAHSRVLEIATYRSDVTRLLETRATVHTREDGYMRHVFGFGTGQGDFSARVSASSAARVTEKVVREQHESVMRALDSIRALIDIHYEAQQPTAAAVPALS